MGIISSNKTISVQRIDCNGNFQVQLALSAAPDIATNPTDIVLLLDRSSSMAGAPLTAIQAAARQFVQIIAQAVGGLANQPGVPTRIGIVSFASDVQTLPLGTAITSLDTAINNLTPGNGTNHAAAFSAAQQMLEDSADKGKVIVLFTDGITTEGGSADTITDLIKSQGTVIYAAGLAGSDGLNQQALNAWASAPAAAYVSVAESPDQLSGLLDNLSRNITKAGASNILLSDQVNDCFRITSLCAPTKGSASLLNATTVQWQMDRLGTTQMEGATLTFTVQHVGTCTGTVTVNQEVNYSDAQNNVVTFPSPEIMVDCGIVIIPETCPQPVSITMTGCQDTVEFNAGLMPMEGQGGILQLSVTLQKVCPGKRVALAVVLNEVDDAGVEYPRGMKIIRIPAHNRPTCQDVTVECIHFVLPAEESLAEAPCALRSFRARFLANYMDGGFACCGRENDNFTLANPANPQ